jgi:alpha-beta hydrolase superfamily lysophospholipase
MTLRAEETLMTLAAQHAPDRTWTEPDGIASRGTVIVIPGRGEQAGLYERFGRRIASDGYRVHAVTDPTLDEAAATAQIAAQLAGDAPAPQVLAGSDSGALFAVALAAADEFPGFDALVLAGLPAPARTGSASLDPGSWDGELDARTTCPTHRGRLAGPQLRRGALYDPVPAGWLERADLSRVRQPILGLHGADDLVSPLGAARDRYAAAPRADLVSIAGGRHDAFNDQTHRTVAATVILFLERLRLDQDRLTAIARTETLDRAGV